MPDNSNICVPFEEDLVLICEAVKGAGEIAREAFNNQSDEIWDKGKGHLVTETDIAVNEYLAEMLTKARPDYGWLSEETKDDHSRHACPRTFVVDPIDGTRAFIDRSPNFAVSVAVIEDGRPIAGALYNPLKDELYQATRGGGATLNSKVIRVSERKSLAGARMVGYPRKFRRLGWPDMDVVISNSMAYRIALVASGQADATVSFTPKSDWDLAAAELIATEAGAKICNLRGESFRYDRNSTSEFGVICAGPNLQALLMEMVEPVIEKFETSTDRKKDFGFMGTRMSDRNENDNMQLLHLVIGGELVDPNKTEFIDLSKVDFVGAYGSYKEARAAWLGAAQRTVDNAHMRYFVLHAHELIDPDKDGFIG